MATLVVPPLDLSFPTLGPAIADLIEDRFTFGPGSLAGQPAVLDDEKRGALYRLYEVYPKGHRLAGRRLHHRGGIEWRKGKAKTELGAWVAGAELHPEAPVRCDGFDARGNPVGRPVRFPYIPMMATAEDQVERQAYGVLKFILEHSPDANLFDISLERILRLGRDGAAAGKAEPVAVAPNSADGDLTTFQLFDEPHRLYLPRQREAHETMHQNLVKRPMEDPWSLYISTAGAAGQGSIQEDLRHEAEAASEGRIPNTSLFFVSRWAGPEHNDLSTMEKRIAAVAEAQGPVGEYGPGQFERIAQDYDRPKVDKAYWERVNLNRWRRSGSQFFDLVAIRDKGLIRPGEVIADGRFVTLGFDGARFRDATALVAADIASGLEQVVGLWEKPEIVPDGVIWEVDEDEVTQTVTDAMHRWEVWKLYADPPHWTETVGSWAAKWPDQVEEWWTKRHQAMAYALREYVEAIDAETITFGGTAEQCDDLIRHLANAGRRELKIRDDEGIALAVMGKQDGRMDLMFDAAMAGSLAWKARLDAIKAGAKPKRGRKRRTPRRLI